MAALTNVAARFEELINDEANDELTPSRSFSLPSTTPWTRVGLTGSRSSSREAQFPTPTASIAEIDYREGRGINPTRMRRYAAHDWSTETANLLITSPTGGGKTYIACAIGVAACHNEHGNVQIGVSVHSATDCLVGHSESTCVTIGKHACKHRVAPGMVRGQ